jgi:mannitol-1-phosphate 5-dehydrogenase
MGTKPAAVVVFGAGRTGRGLASVLCARSAIPVTLVDRDAAVVERLRAAGKYRMRVLGGAHDGAIEELRPALVAALGDERAWRDAFIAADAAFCAIVGTNLSALAQPLARALSARFEKRGAAPFNLFTCENLSHAAAVLREATLSALPPTQRSAIAAATGFAEAMVLTTSLGPSDAKADPLEVRTQDSFRLPCDAEAFVGGAPAIAGLDPLTRFSHQLVRKIYTYNSINAVVSYLGAERGHRDLADAARDAAIAPLARQAGEEASAALIAEFGFDRAEQATWAASAMAKFEDPAIPDPIARNGADPARKLASEDRLVGPALLALKLGGKPLALARGIASATCYRDDGKASLLEQHGSIAAVLAATAGLAADHPLVALAERAAQAAAHG